MATTNNPIAKIERAARTAAAASAAPKTVPYIAHPGSFPELRAPFRRVPEALLVSGVRIAGISYWMF